MRGKYLVCDIKEKAFRSPKRSITEEMREMGLPIDDDHIKIMNGHIIASWQSDNVSRRVIYVGGYIYVYIIYIYIDTIGPVVSSRPAVSAVSLADLALLEPVSRADSDPPLPFSLSLSRSFSHDTFAFTSYNRHEVRKILIECANRLNQTK